MTEPSDPIETGLLRRIRARRQIQWYVAPALPIVVLLFILAVYYRYIGFFTIVIVVVGLISVMAWHVFQVRSARCPRCGEYFFLKRPPDPLGMDIYEDECQHCGLPLYRPGDDSFV